MNVDSELLEILACPACKAALRVDDPASELLCTNPDCGYAYPVRDDIPVLLVDEARKPGTDQAEPAPPAQPEASDQPATAEQPEPAQGEAGTKTQDEDGEASP